MMTDINLNAVLADLGKFKPTGQPEVDKRTVDYLTSLTKGANPEIPEVMALAQLQAFQKAINQKPAATPPQGTVRDKLAQSAGIMALKGAQQQQAPNPAPQGMPIPAGIPQPEMQEQPQAEEAQPTMAAAQGGLMRARVDPRMFEYTRGGIVAFAGGGGAGGELAAETSEGELASDEVRVQRAQEEIARIEKEKAREEKARQMRFLEASAPEVAAKIKAEEAASAPPPKPAPAPKPVSEGPSTLGAAQQEYIRLIKQGMPREMAEKVLQASMGASQSGIATAPGAAGPAAPRPLAAPRPPVAPAGPAAAPPPAAQGINALARDLMPENKYMAQAGAAYTAAEPEKFNAAQEIGDTVAIQKALGVGRYGEEAQRRIDEREKRYEESKKDRGSTRLDTMLDAIIRPGYRVGEASQARSKKIEEFKAADKEFAESQDVLKDAKAKYDEALAVGNANAILKRRDELKKAQQDYKLKKVDFLNEQAKIQNTASGNALSAATQVTTNAATNQTNLQTNAATNATNLAINRDRNFTDVQVANIREAAAKAGYNKPSEAERVGEKYYGILQKDGPKAAAAFLANESKIRAAVSGVKYEGQDTSTKDSKAVEDVINKRTETINLKLQNPNLKPADREKYETLRKNIAAQVRREMGATEGSGGARVVTEADIQATMRSSGKSRDEVVKAANDRGYTIQ